MAGPAIVAMSCYRNINTKQQQRAGFVISCSHVKKIKADYEIKKKIIENNKIGGGERYFLIDRIDFFSLIQLIIRMDRSAQIRYFEEPGSIYRWLIQRLNKLAFFKGSVCPVDYRFSEMKDQNGRLIYIEALEEALMLSLKIKKEFVELNPLVIAAKQILNNEKITLHFQEIFRAKIRPICLQIYMAEWYLKAKNGIYPECCILFLRKSEWTPIIREFALKKGVRSIPYFSIDISLKGGKYFEVIGSYLKVVNIYRVLVSFLKNCLKRFLGIFSKHRHSDQIPDLNINRLKKIFVAYSFRKITLNSSERSELFWMKNSGISPNNLVIYGNLKSDDVDEKTVISLKENGLTVLGRGAYTTPFYPSTTTAKVFVYNFFRLLVISIKSVAKKQNVSFFYFKELTIFFAKYSFWYDLFLSNNIKVRISADSVGSVAQTAALDTLGGLSIGYQYSSGVLNSPFAAWTTGENISFLFSSLYLKSWHKIEAPIEKYMFSGFIDDYQIENIKTRSPGKMWRSQLLDAGAKFIICFFDENSTERWDHFATNESAAEDYQYLLEWLLSDNSIGLICKPKKWATLFNRIKTIRPLIEKAKKTGRCIFLGSETLVSSIFPAEAAYNADICIAKLVGTAAALEASLLGVDTFLVDQEGLRTKEFTEWGKGKFLFDNWDELKIGIENFRKGFGQEKLRYGWEKAISELDPYQDGQAYQRIGRFMHWIMEGFSNGMDRQDALKYAIGEFETNWPQFSS